MRVNLEQKTADMEERDLSFVLQAYLRQYLYMSKNEDPVEILVPMVETVPHPYKPGATVPIRYVPVMSPEAMEVKADGRDVDERDAEIERLKAEVEDLRASTPVIIPVPKSTIVEKPVLPTLPSRQPKQPEHPATGQLDEMHPRGRGDQAQTKRDLTVELEVDESKERPYGKKVKRGQKGELEIESEE